MLFILACGGSDYQVADQTLSPPNVCEQQLPGECYSGHWIWVQKNETRNEQCYCKRSKKECAEACGVISMDEESWTPLTCLCRSPQ